jgi:hypothetical protein
MQLSVFPQNIEPKSAEKDLPDKITNTGKAT